MDFEQLKAQLLPSSKDAKLNLGQLFNSAQYAGLDAKDIHGMAMACAYALKNKDIASAISSHQDFSLDAVHLAASQSAASIMAMNNVYYRSVHLMSAIDLKKTPAGLRMNQMAQHGIDQNRFELYATAVSALNGCGMCLDAHAKVLSMASVSASAIQMALKVAAIIASVDCALAISAMEINGHE